MYSKMQTTVERVTRSGARRRWRAIAMLTFGIVWLIVPLRGAHAADEFLTEYVFLVVIDGLRWSESFGDPTHQHIPVIWDSLVPHGTMYKNLYNTLKTQSTPSHGLMLNGNRLDGWAPNNHWNPPDTDLPLYPTLFELYRKQTGAPRNRCWILTGNGVLRDLDRSLYPTYGDSLGAYLRYDADSLHAEDDTVWAWVQQVMDDERPDLMMVNFFAVDLGGHRNWDEYIAAIEHVDSLIFEFWKKIQAIPPYTDTYYKDKTTMLLTTDHGRDQADYHHHTKSDIGSRRLIFLGLGPDVMADEVVTVAHDHIDICTTIAALMGIDTPYAQGGVMDEMFIPGRWIGEPALDRNGSSMGRLDEARLTDDGARSESPSFACDGESLYVAWADTRDGLSHIYFKQSADGGNTWSPDTLLVDAYAIAPLLAVDAGVLHLAWVEFVIRPGSPTTLDWELRHSRSTDSGLNWSEPAHLTPEKYGTFFPTMAASGGDVACFVTGLPKHPQRQKAMQPAFVASSDTGVTWDTMIRAREVLELCHAQPGGVGHGGAAIHAVYTSFVDENWETYYTRSTDGGATWVHEENLSQSAEASRLSDIAVDDTTAYAVWSEQVDEKWQILFRKSTDGGDTWLTAEQLTNSAEGALSPRLACSGQHLWIVWTDYESGRGEIFWKESTDGGDTWSTEAALSAGTMLSINPAIDVADGQAFVAWQDNRDGNWEIYLRPVPESEQRAVVEDVRHTGRDPSGLGYR